LILLLLGGCPVLAADDLAAGFERPPAAARPWVYWFWLNSNITRAGITADLEAMKRVGIGGVLIMEVDQGIPVGPVSFMSPSWREHFQHAVSEAHRLGLEVNMNNDAGWNGSGGPWIKPEESMQEVVWSETGARGPSRFSGVLPRPEARRDFYRDIAVLAVPSTGDARLPDFESKAAFQSRGRAGKAGKPASPAQAIARDRVLDLTGRMGPGGKLTWDAPDGNWTILRIGHSTTGMENAPAPASGRGLECDKLSPKGIEANFAGMMAKLAHDVGPDADKTLVATHIDSWENGSQNWTEAMREEFRKRRGYDMTSFLPVMTGRVVVSPEVSERFLWDLRQTVSELVLENYAGRMRDLAHQHGMKFTAEAYGSPCDHLPYGGMADEPMGEFWVGGSAIETCRGMASSAHIYGKPIVGAEAFTADNRERWTQHPATIKALGDRAFSEGINRFVFHRYALQPWADVRPGMTMGPWGIHYERTETWWDWTTPWHEYLARCQYLLRRGRFVADLCYLQAEAPPQGFRDHPRKGYGWDECPADVVLNRMSISGGRLELPDGMSYRLLVLPETDAMTPALLGKIKQLVEAGATVVGPRPVRSPSLRDYPRCDQEVKALADALWGDCDGRSVKEHRLGRGRVVWGIAPEEVLAAAGVPPDFSSRANLNQIHRREDDTELYFVANPAPTARVEVCSFRVTGKMPEFWWPDSGRIEAATTFTFQDGVTRVSVPLGPSGSVFVVFRISPLVMPSVAALVRDGQPVLTTSPGRPPRIVVGRAVYGVLGDPARIRDVTDKVRAIVAAGADRFEVTRMAAGDDPAFGVVKTLQVNYSVDGVPGKARATDQETIVLEDLASRDPGAELHWAMVGHLSLEAGRPGRYEVQLGDGAVLPVREVAVPLPIDVAGPWEVSFDRRSGGPAHVTFETLTSWTEHAEPAIKYASGTATYRKSLDIPAGRLAEGRRLRLDLGKVEVMARPRLNGKDLGILWKPPFVVDVTDVARPGPNTLEVQVVNLWINRMIGDEGLPEDSPRNPDGTLKAWPGWLNEGKPSPAGRSTFTTWRLWHKGDALVPSGLLGPVRLVSTFRTNLD
jgi:hypothetical protein